MTQHEVQNIEVGAGDDGQRLDRWLKKNVPDMPYGLIQKLVRKGAIRVNDKKSKTDSRLAQGQIVRIPVYEKADMSNLPKKPSYKITEDDRAFMEDIILFDDGDIIAINKPAGLATQGGGEERRHIDGLLPVLENKNGLIPKLVHRLDKETSGVLLLARTPESVRALGELFKRRDVRKTYYAVTIGVPQQREGTIKAPIGKVKGPHKDKMTIDEEDGKYAETDYIVMDKAGRDYALVAFWPRTGRTHQIRVHCDLVLECPIVGDRRYHGDKLVRERHMHDGQNDDRADISALSIAPRLHLHAACLSFRHPQTGKDIDIRAYLPDTLKQNWNEMGFQVDLRLNPFDTEEPKR
jgi:23S rRNA pseudouridine955/2504/2580 synthase